MAPAEGSQECHESIRILIVDDHPLIQHGLSALLSGAPGTAVVGTANTLAEALTATEELQPNLVLLDHGLPDGGGSFACRSLIESQASPRVIVVTLFADPELARHAFRNGAHGYVVKASDPSTLLSAIHAVMEGSRYIDPTISEPGYGLTTGELRVMNLVAQGLTNREVASHLGISPETAKVHIRRIVTKLGASNRTDASVRAAAAGLLSTGAVQNR